jgi:acyl carrier protein
MDFITTIPEEKVAAYIADNILFSKKGFPYPEDASLLENGIIDSMNVLELVMFVEEQFGFQVDDSEIIPANFDSIQKIGTYIRNKSTGDG